MESANWHRHICFNYRFLEHIQPLAFNDLKNLEVLECQVSKFSTRFFAYEFRTKKADVFVPDKDFYPNLTFVCVGRSLPCLDGSTLNMFHYYSQILWLTYKGVHGTNTAIIYGLFVWQGAYLIKWGVPDRWFSWVVPSLTHNY
jgi:hypothetical protein